MIFLVHLSRKLKCTIVIMRCPSSVVVNFSPFRLLLWNHWTEFNETWQEARITSSTKFVFFGPIGITKWPSWPLIGWHIFDFSSESAERNSTKLDRKQDLKVLYQVCVFRVDRKNKMAVLASDWLRQYRLLLWNHWTDFNETWQEARSQCPLPSLCFSGRSEKQDGRPGLWLAETFSTSPLKLLDGIQQTWQEARSQCPLPSLCFFGPIGKIRWLPCPLIGWDIFDFSKTTEWNSMKLHRTLDHNVLYQVCVFGPIEKKTRWPPGLWLADTFSTSPLKLLNGIERNMTGSKMSTSSTKFVFFELIRKTRWLPWLLIGCNIFDFSSETIEWNSTKLYRKQDLNFLYQFWVFGLIGKTRWLPRPLIGWNISTSLKPLNGIQRNLTESKISTSSTKFVFFWSISIQKLQPWLLCQKGCTLYSGARYVALWASCFHRHFYINIIGCLKLYRDEHSFLEILNNYWVFKCTHLLMHLPEIGYSWSFWCTVILYYPIDSGL